ncbi:hypothetical protein [Sphingobacterium griseoflavum]|uniref:Auto-transporter adhesin head GIN domain-containing protein n=1 Tax=Sphingobacterium griseoflavum TaxID=1474952 RepID=A0ABQ3HVJ1_9SPHI|nr:hypothetical protein [Sphingobacterium griseoflavum]GHE23413.1 hypothetical protein GCM10017764_03810 [Sphingobacterium griseoflavum]
MMKTSSKLLIILGIALFLVPISIMSFTVLRNRVDIFDYQRDMDEESSSLEVEDVYLRSTKVDAFEKIRFEGNDQMGPIELIVVKSDQHGVKLDKNISEALKFDVDKNGVLTVSDGGGQHVYFSKLYVFSPRITALDLQDVDLQIKIQADSLAVKGYRLRGFSIQPGSKVDHLALTAKDSYLGIDEHNREGRGEYEVGSLVLDVDNSNVSLDRQGWRRLTIKAKDAKVRVRNSDKGRALDDLILATQGTNDIKLDSLQAKRFSGSLSDQTVTDLPVEKLRSLIMTR